MDARYFALIIGIIFISLGFLGFVPNFVQPPPPGAPGMVVSIGYGFLFGIFPVNILHNLVHLIIGGSGILAYGQERKARFFSQSLTGIYGILAVMGLIPLLNVTFGLIPIYGYDVGLHAITAAVAAYFGFSQKRRVEMPVRT